MQQILPNNSPLPDNITDTNLQPLMGPGPIMFSEVAEDTAIGAKGDGTLITPQGPVNDLMAIRAKFPFLPIHPIPQAVRTYYLAANVAQDVNIPDGHKAFIVRGSGNYFMSFAGAADVPSAASAGNNDNTSRSIYKPDGTMWYAADTRQFSIVTPDANAIVTVMFYAPDQMPRY